MQDGYYLNYDAVPSLSPDEVAREYANLRVPATWSLERHIFLPSADAKRVADESQEANVSVLSVEIVERVKYRIPKISPELSDSERITLRVVSHFSALIEAAQKLSIRGLLSEPSQASLLSFRFSNVDSTAIYLTITATG